MDHQIVCAKKKVPEINSHIIETLCYVVTASRPPVILLGQHNFIQLLQNISRNKLEVGPFYARQLHLLLLAAAS